MSTASPGMTARDTPESQPRAPQRTMLDNRFERVRGATGIKSAVSQRPEQKSFSRRNHQAIDPKP
jgi:hypothetical protein